MMDPNMQYTEPDTPWSYSVQCGSLQQQPYIGSLTNSDNVVGVALNGVFLFAGLSEKGYDAFYPKSYGKKTDPAGVSVDICLGASQSYNTYRYYMFSPCL